MGTPNDKAIVFAQKNKSEPKSFIQDKSVPDTTKETGSFLDTHDLGQFRNSALFAARACQADMKKRKELSEGLLAPVFNADPAQVDAFFKQPNAKKEMVLAKSCYREGYQSKKQNKFVVFRNWKSVSALQAAALCLDKFLVIKLLAQIVADDNLRIEAKKQLEEIRNRIMKENKEKQESINSAAKVTGVSSPTNECSNGDRKGIDEMAQQNSSADLSEYGASIKALLQAYSDYLTQHPSLFSQGKWEELDKLWDVVGSRHKRLPRYVLQEIFKERCWVDDSDFSLEPPRGELRYWNNDLLDLDGLGDGCLVGLYKGVRGGCRSRGARDHGRGATLFDSVPISHLCELRLVDLGNIIDALQTPEAATALTASDKGMGLKRS